MGAFYHDDVFDYGLRELMEATVLHICSSQPTAFAQIAGYSLGSKSGPSVAAPSDRSAGGREAVVSAITDGACSGAGDAAYIALADASRCLYSAMIMRSFGMTAWAIAAAVGTITLEDTTAVAALMTLLNARSPSYGSVYLAAAFGSIPAGWYTITAINVASRTISFMVAAANGGASATGTVNVGPYPQTVTSGNPFTLPSFAIGMADPA